MALQDFLLRADYSRLSKMNLLDLPVELSLRIYDFCFPPPGTAVKIIPYITSSSSCHLNLPLPLYLVSRTIYAELPLLRSKLRQLDFTFLVVLSRPSIGELKAEDSPLARTLQFAERLRVVGTEWPRQRFFPPKMLFPSSHCAVKVIELQPDNCSLLMVINILELCWPILSHPHVKRILKIKMIREDEKTKDEKTMDEETMDEIESFLEKLNRKLNMSDS